MAQELKVCSKCKGSLPANPDFFREDPRMSSGLSSHCIECNKKYVKISARRKYAKSKGMTLEEYDTYSKQKAKDKIIAKEDRRYAFEARKTEPVGYVINGMIV